MQVNPLVRLRDRFPQLGRAATTGTASALLPVNEKLMAVKLELALPLQERSYHIFYMLCGGGPPDLIKRLRWSINSTQKPSLILLLHRSSCIAVESSNTPYDCVFNSDGLADLKAALAALARLNCREEQLKL